MSSELIRLTRRRDLLIEQMSGMREMLTELNRDVHALEKRTALRNFRLLAAPLTWAVELTEDLKRVRLTAWSDRHEEKQAEKLLVEALGLKAETPQALPGEGGSVVWDGHHELHLVCNYIEHLPAMIEAYDLKVRDRGSTIEKIARKVEALTQLRAHALRLYEVSPR